ncbi:uncharacterized protein IAS62_001938 [Cryptococcus decagattii]|uniref:Uncharacterized protein n=1 Tax=Cryptococcus decagattii TaxID=1859122 RepID=A0ABZ2ARW5_9TREE
MKLYSSFNTQSSEAFQTKGDGRQTKAGPVRNDHKLSFYCLEQGAKTEDGELGEHTNDVAFGGEDEGDSEDDDEGDDWNAREGIDREEDDMKGGSCLKGPKLLRLSLTLFLLAAVVQT